MIASDAGNADRAATSTDLAKRIRAGTLIAAPIAVLHTILVWRALRGPFLADHGRWLHEVERLAAGEVLFRDFTWPFPPLALWMVGLSARVFGAGLGTINATMIVVFAAITTLFVVYASQLSRDPKTTALVVLAGLVAAIAAAQIASSPLPNGMYTPAAPVGGMFLLGAVVAGVRAHQSEGATAWGAAGVLAGCAILTKQDFWAPAVVLTCGAPFAAVQRRTAIAAPAAACMTVLIGIAIVGATAGAPAIIEFLTGGGHGMGAIARGLPTLERLTVGLIVVGAWAALIFALTSRHPRDGFRRALLTALIPVAAAALWIVATHRVITSVPNGTLSTLRGVFEWHLANGSELFRPLVGELLGRVRGRLFPVIGPLLVAAWVLRRPRSPSRSLFLLLLAVCAAARARRLFEYTEWYHYLLEIPVFTPILLDSVRRIRPARVPVATMALLLPILVSAAVQYHHEGIGIGTAQAQLVPIPTARGVVRLTAGQTGFFFAIRDALNAADPTGRRPVFAYGKTGGANYFFGRPNPTPSTHGFVLSARAAELEDVLRKRRDILLLDIPVYDLPEAPLDLTTYLRLNPITQWDTQRSPALYALYDRPIFDRIVAGCRTLERWPTPAGEAFRLIDCAD